MDAKFLPVGAVLVVIEDSIGQDALSVQAPVLVSKHMSTGAGVRNRIFSRRGTENAFYGPSNPSIGVFLTSNVVGPFYTMYLAYIAHRRIAYMRVTSLRKANSSMPHR
nr:uncharacterized protein LOC127337055 [Lolium perenne]